MRRVKQWEIIADNLHKSGWSLGWVSALDREGRTIWIVDAHGYGKRFIVRADELLTAFFELETATRHGDQNEANPSWFALSSDPPLKSSWQRGRRR
jgi:hypothetical protein